LYAGSAGVGSQQMRAGQVRQTMRQTAGGKGNVQMNALTKWLKNFWIRRPFLASGACLAITILIWWLVDRYFFGWWSIILFVAFMILNVIVATMAITRDNANYQEIKKFEDELNEEEKK
jgi:hypothetical protein